MRDFLSVMRRSKILMIAVSVRILIPIFHTCVLPLRSISSNPPDIIDHFLSVERVGGLLDDILIVGVLFYFIAVYSDENRRLRKRQRELFSELFSLYLRSNTEAELLQLRTAIRSKFSTEFYDVLNQENSGSNNSLRKLVEKLTTIAGMMSPQDLKKVELQHC
ncbi:MAG: hypothetical protein EOP06_25480 [Proteobacteria bacterium]|nr:MAG: hypothetical protein EOP06_25480 [Pseudomonadota bacterium]